MLIKTIVFDLGKVIIPFDFKRGYERLAPLCAYPAAQIPERLRSCDLVTRFESGDIEPRNFVEQISQMLHLQASYEQFCDIWSSIFLPETLIPEEMILGLKGRYRLLVLSNTNALHFPMVRAGYPILNHFDDYILSYEVGAMKPSPKIYQETIRRAHASPAEIFFTDDIAAYVEGAKQEGIDAVQFESAEQIRRELLARGVALSGAGAE